MANLAGPVLALVIPAPIGGGTIKLTTDNPSVIHVPASVSIPAGNSAVRFAIAAVLSPGCQPADLSLPALAAVTKSISQLTSLPTRTAPPLLQSMSITPTSVTGNKRHRNGISQCARASRRDLSHALH